MSVLQHVQNNKYYKPKKVYLDSKIKLGGKHSTFCVRRIKRIFKDLEILNEFDEQSIAKYTRFYLHEIMFLGRKELEKEKPDSDRFLVAIKKLPFHRRRKTGKHSFSDGLYVGKIQSYAQAISVVGSLSRPSKIPTFGYALPVTSCKTGSELRKEINSTCSVCYGFGGWYKMPWVQVAMEKRSLAILHDDWVDAMIYLMFFHHLVEFRWHDTGDLQSLIHLHKIITVALTTPDIVYWLPTQELDMIKKYWENNNKIKFSKFVPNLKIRLSSKYINEQPPTELATKLGVLTSMVVDSDSKIKFNCPSSLQDNKCRECRECWTDKLIIIYKKH